jgi:UPF0716 protein FxsA
MWFARLLLLFTLVPLVELFLLLQIGQYIGLPSTLGLVLLTGVLGAWLARQQGLRTLTRLRGELAAGRMPGETLIDGVLILVAGAVLLTPGLLTDLLGFALLTPAVRTVIRKTLAQRFQDHVQFVHTATGAHRPRVIEIEPEDPGPTV